MSYEAGAAVAMTEEDLLLEWLSYPGITSTQIEQLRAAGVPPRTWIAAGEITAPRIRSIGRVYMPDPFGERAFCLRVVDGRPPSPDYCVLDPLVDLLAFRLEAPATWWLRRGGWGLALSKHLLIDALLDGIPVRLVPNPLEWLRAGCAAACPLDLAANYRVAGRTVQADPAMPAPTEREAV